MSGTNKYQGSKDPIDGRPLIWGVHPDGFPIRQGSAPTLIDQQQLANATQERYFQTKMFRIPEQLDDYTKVMDWLFNGGGVVYDVRVREVPDDAAKWTVWLQWVEIRGRIPQRGPE